MNEKDAVEAKKESYLEQLGSGLADQKEELIKLTDAINMQENTLVAMDKEVVLRKKLHVEIQKGIKKIEPSFEYEKSDEYWSLQKELNNLRFGIEIQNMSLQKDQALKNLDAKKESLERLKGELE